MKLIVRTISLRYRDTQIFLQLTLKNSFTLYKALLVGCGERQVCRSENSRKTFWVIVLIWKIWGVHVKFNAYSKWVKRMCFEISLALRNVSEHIWKKKWSAVKNTFGLVCSRICFYFDLCMLRSCREHIFFSRESYASWFQSWFGHCKLNRESSSL